MTTSIILASGSATRRIMLEAAGLSVIADSPNLDEGPIKLSCRNQGLPAGETARMLAVAKATEVASRYPGKIVLGADQMLECEGVWFDKPVDQEAAARQIGKLSGRTHTLFSAVAAIRDDAVIWRTVETAEMTMRELSPAFIEAYLDLVGDAALFSVGGYQVEGPGIQLFSAIQGDHSTILGTPLLPLLEFLRDEGVVAR